MRPQFAREQVSDLDLEERHVQNMMRAIDASTSTSTGNSNTTIDLQELFFRLTLDSASEFLFGQSVDSQITLAEGGMKAGGVLAGAKSKDFATAFDLSQNALAVSYCFLFYSISIGLLLMFLKTRARFMNW